MLALNLNDFIRSFSLYDALVQFQSQGVDLTKTYLRRAFYGKQGGRNPFIYEHVVPASVIREQLIANRRNHEKIKEILSNTGQVAVILREEDKKLRKAGLAFKMPEDWSFGDDLLARYDTVGVVLSDKFLNVTGAICR